VELSFDDIKGLVRAALQQEHAGATYIYVRDCYPDSVVYSIERGQVTEPAGSLYYRRGYVVTSATDGNVSVTLGKLETVAKKSEYATVKAFSMAEFSAETDAVVFKGKVFEAGDYPDKGVSFTPAELQAIASQFTPVENDLEHRETILSGQLGKLQNVQAMDGGAWLYGEVALPKWLADLTAGQPIGTSLAFDANKRIVGNALTLNPRIPGAQVAAAFAEFVGKRNSTRDQNDLQKVHDLAVNLGASCGSTYTAHSPKEKKPMKIKDALAAILAKFSGGGNVDLEAEIGVGDAPATFNSQTNPDVVRLTAEIENIRAGQIAAEAKRFTDDLVAECRLLPAQADGVRALFTAAARDDIAAGGAKFAAESGEFTPGDRTKSLMDVFKNAPRHSLTKEQLAEAGAGAVFSTSEGAKPPVINPNEIYEDRRKATSGGN
jgi:hypothetical protein